MDEWICPDCRAVHGYKPREGCARTVAREEDGSPIRCAVYLVPYVNGKAVRVQKSKKPKTVIDTSTGPTEKPKGRRCGICREYGHRRETCSNKD